MGTKRLIFAIIVVILLIAGLIGGYYYIQNGSQQAEILQKEMTKVLETDIINDELDMSIKSNGNYGKVEETVKNYLNDSKKIFISMKDFCNEEQAEKILSAENINGDPVELLVVKQKVEEKKQEFNTLKTKAENMDSESSINGAIEGKDIKENYINVYKNIMNNEAMQEMLTTIKEKAIDEQEEAEERLEGLEDTIDFLAKNSKYWEINDGKIQFTNTNKLAEYLEVLNGGK